MEIVITALIVFKKELLEILRDRRTMLLLFSPPLIHAVETLNAQQQEHIRAMLES